MRSGRASPSGPAHRGASREPRDKRTSGAFLSVQPGIPAPPPPASGRPSIFTRSDAADQRPGRSPMRPPAAPDPRPLVSTPAVSRLPRPRPSNRTAPRQTPPQHSRPPPYRLFSALLGLRVPDALAGAVSRAYRLRTALPPRRSGLPSENPPLRRQKSATSLRTHRTHPEAVRQAPVTPGGGSAVRPRPAWFGRAVSAASLWSRTARISRDGRPRRAAHP